MKKVSDILQTNRYVVIKGNPGAGKTTIAMHILTGLHKKGKLPLKVTTVQDLYGSVPPFSNVALFLDNLFGEFTMSNEVDNFDSKFHLIRAMCSNDNNDKGNVLIVTIRSDIYNEAAEKLSTGDSFFTNSMVDISNGDFQLQNLEIIELFKKYGLDKLLESNTLLDISKIGNTFGIPQCCNLLKNNPTLSEDTFGFLKNPIQSLQIYLKNILDRKECKTAVLVYLLLCGGSVEENVLQTPLQDTTRKKQSLEIIGTKNATLMDFHKSIYHYHNFLMTYNPIEREYKFSHSSVQESLFKCLVNFYPLANKIITSCDHVLLERLTTCKNLSWNSVVITEDIFKEIIKRLLDMLEQMSVSSFRTISRLQIWKDEKFMSECITNQKLLHGIKQNTDDCGQTMLVHFCVSGNIRWAKYLLPSSSQEQRYMSLNEACAHNQKDIVDLILTTDVRYDLKTCFHSVQSGDLDMLYRFTENVDLTEKTFSCHNQWNCKWGLLHEICFFGQNRLIKPVISRYPYLLDVQNDEGENVLHLAAYAGDENLFKNLIQRGSNPYGRSKNGSTVLHFACQNGKLSMVRYICDTYPDLLLSDYNDNVDHTPLHWSAQSGNIELYEYLVGKGLQQILPQGRTPLHEACVAGKLEMCKYLIENSQHMLHIRDNNGESVLLAAALGGNVDLFRFLLGNFSNINATCADGKSVLHLCCKQGKLDMCKYLVNTYPHLLDIKDNNGNTVLHTAAWGGNIDLFKFLMEKGSDIKSTKADGKNVLHLCCVNRKLNMCKYLVENYVNLLHMKDNDGNNALLAAAYGGNIDIFTFLLRKGLNINDTTNDRNTVLHQCCINGQLDMAKYLTNAYPHLLDIKDKYGVNVLHTASWGGYIDLFKFLLKKGMDINITSNDGRTVFHQCCMNGKLEMCEYLFETFPHLLDVKDKDGENVLHAAAEGENIELLKFLLDRGREINSLTSEGKHVLHLCCMNGSINMCKYIVNAYPHLQKVGDYDYVNALHAAAWGGNIDLLNFLLANGSDIYIKSFDGKTVLHFCCANGKLDMCKFLINTYPNLLHIKYRYKNALHAAAFGGNVDLFNFLLEKGLKIETSRYDGKTVLHQCCENGKVDMCKYLMDAFPHLKHRRDKFDNNALHAAASGGNIELINFLLEKGFDMKTKRRDGKTASSLLLKQKVGFQ